VVLVTGAARGIGAEAARQLAARGARLALVGLEPEELAKVADECGPDAISIEADVTDAQAMEAAVTATVERFGRIDVLIANAGIASSGLIRFAERESFERTIEVNLLGSYRTIAAALPHLIASKGYLLQIASVAAFTTVPGLAAYGASKAGVESLCNTLRHEVGHHGVDVGVAYFWFIDTDLVRASRETVASSRSRGVMDRAYPVSTAGAAIVRGIEQRARWVFVPRWAKALMMMRALLPVLTQRPIRRQMPQVEAEIRADLEARGAEASRPVGPGGEAAMRAAEQRGERVG
jgi:NAD(P)-dependent dehydrogenase (short-subunit alcohol dehydrogenase family)